MFILLIVFVKIYYKVLSLFVHFITKTTSFEFCRKVNYICQLNMEISHDDDSLIVKFSIN